MALGTVADDALPMTPTSARLFLALWPSSKVRDELLQWRDAWNWPRAASLVAPERLHLTLHFLGLVPRCDLPSLADGLDVEAGAFDLGFGRPALWPGGIAVLQPLVAPAGLLQLHRRLQHALQLLSRPVEDRPFRPHVTLARHADGATLPEPGPALHWRVRGYALVESKQAPESGYRVVRRYRLAVAPSI